ncbi:hypothetical protein Tsubulata_003773 [Turnera subulata]|uniref:S-adenosylmethionine synthetase central domain-containing protein n=1 Tax=Turnera subulata TaxID=218843 RepID=A0A9Q0G045_9ROSI|nr:hypothetical protein Tsubulata_003773 [Turnera subulata]
MFKCKHKRISFFLSSSSSQELENIGAADQGHMFGHATVGISELMPLSHVLATKLGAPASPNKVEEGGSKGSRRRRKVALQTVCFL